MSAALNDDTDLCFVCRLTPAMTLFDGMCAECYSRATWTINPPRETDKPR